MHIMDLFQTYKLYWPPRGYDHIYVECCQSNTLALVRKDPSIPTVVDHASILPEDPSVYIMTCGRT
jgi:hypothetical protein